MKYFFWTCLPCCECECVVTKGHWKMYSLPDWYCLDIPRVMCVSQSGSGYFGFIRSLKQFGSGSGLNTHIQNLYSWSFFRYSLAKIFFYRKNTIHFLHLFNWYDYWILIEKNVGWISIPICHPALQEIWLRKGSRKKSYFFSGPTNKALTPAPRA